MSRITKKEQEILDSVNLDEVQVEEPIDIQLEEENLPKITDLGWTDYVMSLLDEKETIAGNPKTDGLRRLVPLLIGPIYHSASKLVHHDDLMTIVEHTLVIGFKDTEAGHIIGAEYPYQKRTFTDLSGANKDNTPPKFFCRMVESAATVAEGRCLRKALNLKRLAAEELADSKELDVKIQEHNPENQSLGEINVDKMIEGSQMAAISVMTKRLDIDFNKYLDLKSLKLNKLTFKNGQDIFQELSQWQREKNLIPGEIKI